MTGSTAGMVHVEWYAGRTRARRTRALIASGSGALAGAVIRPLKLKLTRKGASILALAKTIEITAEATFQRPDHPTTHAAQTFALHR
jgi:hypothetical protein